MKKKLKHSKTIDTSDYILQYGAGGPVNGFIKDPQTALQENNLMWQKALAIGSLDPLAGVIDASIPLIQTAGEILKEKGVFEKGGDTSAASGMSTSGKTVNVEGGEILENPKGDILKIKGPKHEKGGVTLDLPMNSPEDNYNIYSDRIEGKTGKTLAREKEDREKKIARYQKHLEKFPGDIAARNTLERLIKSSKLADLNAVNLQKELRETAQMGQAEINIPEEESQSQQIPGPGESEGMLGQLTAASGISTGKNPGLGGREILDEEELLSEEDYLLSLGINPYTTENIGENTGQVLSKEGNIEEVVMTKKLKPFVSKPVDVSVNSKFIPTNPELKNSPPLLRTDSSATPNTNPKKPNLGPSGFTSGDIVGALGMIKQGLASRRGAMNNLTSLQPEVNKYKNYGRKAVEALQANQSVADREYQRTLANNELDTFKNNSNIDTSSRGIGDKMANLVALQQITNRANANAEDAYADKTVQNNAEMAKTLQTIEDKYLTEETRVQDDNMRNLDAAMEGVTQAGVNEGKMLAYLGKILNARKERDMTRAGINAQNLRVQIDKDGNYIVLPQEPNNAQPVTPNKEAIDKQIADALAKREAEALAKKEASEAAKTETPVTPTDTPYVTGDKTLDSFDLGTERNNLIAMLQNPKVNMKIDLGNPESIKELQRKIGNTGNNISGKFGAVTYENLKRYIAGETPIQRDPKTGIGFPKKRKK